MDLQYKFVHLGTNYARTQSADQRLRECLLVRRYLLGAVQARRSLCPPTPCSSIPTRWPEAHSLAAAQPPRLAHNLASGRAQEPASDYPALAWPIVSTAVVLPPFDAKMASSDTDNELERHDAFRVWWPKISYAKREPFGGNLCQSVISKPARYTFPFDVLLSYAAALNSAAPPRLYSFGLLSPVGDYLRSGKLQASIGCPIDFSEYDHGQ